MVEHLTVQLPGRVVAAQARPGEPGDGAAPADPEAAEWLRQQMQQELQADRSRLAGAIRAVEGAAAEIRQFQAELLAEAEQQLLELALDIARRVLMQEIRAQRYEIEPIVTEALRQIPVRRDVVVHLHPDDHAQCKLGGRDEAADGAAGVRFVADADVRPGECRIETPQGVVESRVEAHLSEITEALKDAERE
jgi:flagellar assembly protein FliH